MALLLLGAGPIDADLANLRAADARLATVAYRLQTANAALCSDVRPLPGFTVEALSQFSAGDRVRVAAQLGLGALPSVAAVAAGSSAEKAGLRSGDALVALGGIAAPGPGGDRYDQIAQTEALIEARLTRGPLDLRVRRSDGERTMTITGDRGCASRVQVIAGGLGATQADGQYAQISVKVLQLAQGDDELAVAVAHELAHNILQHRAKRTPSRQAEFEADRLGVWLVARAGYDPDAPVRFWTRFKAADKTILPDGSHPSWNKRIAAVAAAVAQVRAQMAAAQPLIPPPQ